MAQQRALFISEKFIKNNSEIDDNVDVKKLLPTVFWCQKFFIERVIGSNLYDDLSDKIIAGTLSAVEINLVDGFIADTLLNWFMSEVQVALTYNFRNKSAGTNDSQWSDPVDYQQHRYLRDFYVKRGDYFTERLQTFLCENSKDFPKFTAPTTFDQLEPQDKAPGNPVFLGGVRVDPDRRFINSTEVK